MRKENYWEPCWCNYLRNNINAKDEDGSLVGWGCFTGEPTVEDFIQVHTLKLQPGDHIFLFSDGMIPLIDNIDFLSWFTKNYSTSFYFHKKMRQKIQELLANNPEKDKEKTLIYYQYS